MVLGQPSCEPTMTCKGISHWQPVVRLTPHTPQQRSTEYQHQVRAARSVVRSDWLDLPGGRCLGFVSLHASHTRPQLCFVGQ